MTTTELNDKDLEGQHSFRSVPDTPDPKAKNETQQHEAALTPDEIQDLLGNTEGLTTSAYEEALTKHGYNEVIVEEKAVWLQILGRFLGIVPLFITTTAVLSGAVESSCSEDLLLEPCDCADLRDWASFALLLLELNLVVYADYAGSKSSGDAIRKLQEASASTVGVLRDGAWIQVPTRELVPGDVVAVTIGMTIPADGIFLSEGEPIKLDYSSLTGEPLPEKKKRGDRILSGAVVLVGEGEMLVTQTGSSSSLGTTQALIAEAKQAKEKGGQLARTLSKLVLFLSIFGVVVSVFVGAWISGTFSLTAAQAVKAALVLCSTILPVTMPLILTTTLAVGAQELAADQAVVQRFSSIPELANMDILCSDKTGTLTLGQMTCISEESVVFDDTITVDYMMELALVASRIEHSDAIDAAITKHHSDPAAVHAKYDIKKFVPFDPTTKRVTAVATSKETGEELVIVKGAPPVLFGYSGIDAETYERAQATLEERSERGFKTLAVCTQVDDNEWKLLGLISILDPPRSDTAQTVKRCQELGVEVKMITGDQRLIAVEVARQLDLPNLMIFEKDVFGGNSHVVDQAGGFGSLCEKAGGFAGVSPEHKHRVVTALQERGHFVGMTGDGVNDAPALSIANVGIAVADATDAARGASDIVLQQEGLSTIVKALYGSRKIFKRIETYLTYRLCSSFIFGFAFILIYTVSDYDFPTWTLVLMSLLNDFAVGSSSKDQVVIQRHPVSLNMMKITTVAFVMAVTTSLQVWGMTQSILLYSRGSGHFWGLKPEDDQASSFSGCELAAIIFLNLIVSIQLNLLVARSPKLFFMMKTEKDDAGHFTSVPPPSWYVLGSISASLSVATIIAVYWEDTITIGSGYGMQGIGWRNAGLLWSWCVTWFVITDLLKFITLHIWDLVENNKDGNAFFTNVFRNDWNSTSAIEEHVDHLTTLRSELKKFDASSDGPSSAVSVRSSIRPNIGSGLAILTQQESTDRFVSVQDTLLSSETLQNDPQLLRVVSQMAYYIGELQARLDAVEGKKASKRLRFKAKAK